MLVINRNEGFAPFAGQTVRVTATFARLGHKFSERGNRTTLLLSVYVGSKFVTTHTWLPQGISSVPRGYRFEADCTVEAFGMYDHEDRQTITKYGIANVSNIRILGPANVIEECRSLCRIYGWQVLADAVASLHEEAA
mgnify:CR=1 FL=1